MAKTSKLNQPREQTMKLKTQIVAIVLGLAASTLMVWSADRPLRETTIPTIEGVWRVSRQGVNCNDPNQQLGPPFPALMTFHHDGTVTGATKSPVTGPFDTPEYGLWQREPGNQNYLFREVNYRYDGNGTFIGQLVLTANVELTDASSFTYTATIQIKIMGFGAFYPRQTVYLRTKICSRRR